MLDIPVLIHAAILPRLVNTICILKQKSVFHFQVKQKVRRNQPTRAKKKSHDMEL